MRQKQGKERFLTAEGVERLKPYHDLFVRWDRSKVLTYPGMKAIDVIHEVYTKETGDNSVRASKNCARCLEELFTAASPVYLDSLEKLAETIPAEQPERDPEEGEKIAQKPKKRARTTKNKQ